MVRSPVCSAISRRPVRQVARLPDSCPKPSRPTARCMSPRRAAWS